MRLRQCQSREGVRWMHVQLVILTEIKSSVLFAEGSVICQVILHE